MKVLPVVSSRARPRPESAKFARRGLALVAVLGAVLLVPFDCTSTGCYVDSLHGLRAFLGFILLLMASLLYPRKREFRQTAGSIVNCRNCGTDTLGGLDECLWCKHDLRASKSLS
jgi:hypothetical protein